MNRIILLLSAVLALAGCSGKGNSEISRAEGGGGNAVYFWKTRFELGKEETAFLTKNGVGRIYLRYFDVDYEKDPATQEEGIVPVGTLSFVSERPRNVEIVPVVFITVGAAAYIRYNGLVQDTAQKIIQRVLNMSSYNGVGPIGEVQLDCDWTDSTQETFFALCREVKGLLKGKAVSSTIRLHQLRLPVPPVDRGVLMLYNTGAMRDPSAGNSILDARDVKTYLGEGPVRYALPLDFAYPTYGWGIWFRGGEFMGILHRSDFSDPSRYSDSGDGTFRVCDEHMLEGHRLVPGDMIRLETSRMEAIRETAALVKRSFPGRHSNVIYHLDATNLQHYTRDEIKEIFGY